jgi:hypothetical protein
VGPTKEDVTNLQGVSYDANNVLVVRVKLPDVIRKLKVHKVSFRYIFARKAGRAYDYTITYFCELLKKKSSHLLNFPGGSETLSYGRQFES